MPVTHRVRLFFLSLSFAVQALAIPTYITFPSDIDWVTRESDHFQVMYRSGKTEFGERVLRYAEKAHAILEPIFPKGPEKTFIVLGDFQDSVNGYALNFPYSHIVLFASPPPAGSQLASLENWLFSLVLHEYTHIRHLYPVGGFWKPMRTVFGSWVMPNGLMPSHFHEGIATFIETEFTKGGRGRSPYWRMLTRKAVEVGAYGNSFLPIDQRDGVASLFPQGTSAYYFGYQLYEELWRRKGAKGIYDFSVATSRLFPYFLHVPLHDVYGEDLSYESLWQNIFDKNTAQSKRELEEIKKQPLSGLRYVTSGRQHKWDLARSANGKWVAYRSQSPTEGSAIKLLDGATLKEQKNVETDLSHAEGLCWIDAGDTNWLLYTKASSEFLYNTFKLSAFDPVSRKTIQLKADGFPLDHIHTVGCSRTGKSVLVYRETAGKGSVAELHWDGAKTAVTGKIEFKRKWDIPAGRWVASLLPGARNWIVTRFDTNADLLEWKEGDNPTLRWRIPGHLHHLREGLQGQLLGIGEWDGRSEVFQLDVDKREATKRVAVTGGISGFESTGKDYIVASYEQGGYDIAHAEPVTRSPSSLRSPANVEPQPQAPAEPTPTFSSEKNYSAWGSVLPRTWIPNLLFVPDGAQIGVLIPGFDLAQRHVYNIFGGYDTRGLPFADIDYTYRFAKATTVGFRAYYNPSYILSSAQFLKQWGANISLGGRLFDLPPWISLSLLFRRIETSSLGSGMQSGGIGLDVSYSFGFERKPLSITPRMGTRIAVSHAFYPRFMGSTEQYFTSIVSFDQYLPSPIKWDHGFYLSSRLGYTEGTRRYNSYFQGGGEILFAQSRGYFLNRGFVPGSFFSRRIFNQNVEYRFPIARIERGIGMLPFNLKTIHAAIVADVTSADFGVQFGNAVDLFKTFYYSAGIEVKTEWNFFFYFPSQVRFGAYHAFGNAKPGVVPQQLYFTMGIESYF
jgi:hypothetical protein